MPLYKSLSDQQLVTLLKEGNAFAYTEIYTRYKRLLYIFVYKRLGDREESMDIIQELFLSLWTKHKDIHLTSSLSAYLFTAVRNRMLDVISHKKVLSRYIASFKNYADSGYSATDHLVRHKELSLLIEREIEALPHKMRLVFELSRKTHQTRKEIAEELGLSEQTVKSHMHHALRILKMKLGLLVLIVFFSNI